MKKQALMLMAFCLTLAMYGLCQSSTSTPHLVSSLCMMQVLCSTMMPRKTVCIQMMPVMLAWLRPSCIISQPCLATYSQEIQNIEKCKFSS